ncbi:amidohydrolase family protein [Nocardioides insulae]|uniref:amidohydrolase family protein n=1 Tax=Nocardioides insulae TaxID=394734 RepID=UPI0004129B8A|nr:amidohydrolase family protein [Nocardioides insulae]
MTADAHTDHDPALEPDRPGIAAEPEQVRAWWQALELPGLFDVHVHFMAPAIQRAVWAVFDSAGPKLGRPWPIRYRLEVDERVELLRSFGLRRFSGLPYAHKPGVAAYLNDWAREFAQQVPESLWSATFYPEDDAPTYVGELVSAGVEVFKVHVQVGEFPLDAPELDPVWGILAEAGTPVVIHAGSGPVPGEHTGPRSLAAVLAKHPALTAIVAHLGAPEYAEFLALAARHPRVHLDTTMVFTEFFSEGGGFPADLQPRLVDLQDRILLGSDFPAIPYPYLHQLESLERLGLGEDWLRAVCWHNGARLFGAEPRAI